MSLGMDTSLEEGQVTLRAALWILGFLAVLAPVQCSQGHPSWRYISSEVVIPRKEFQRGKFSQMPGWLSYSLHFGGQRHTIHMRHKKLFWSRHLLMMTQDDQGALQMDYPFIPSDCYYLGYLEEIPLSMVTVDTCSGGLKGIMKLDDLAYEIKPLKYSKMFEHVVSQIVADANATGPAYRLGHKEDKYPLFPEADVSIAPRGGARVFAGYRGYVRGFGQFSNSMYQVFNNVTTCVDTLVRISSLSNSMYEGLYLKFILIAVLIYNVRDPTSMNDFRVPEGAYANYHARHLRPVVTPTVSFMIIRDGPQQGAFTPELYTACTTKDLIFIGQLGRHYFLLSIVVTYSSARTIGLYFDEANCICLRRTTCLMSQYPGLTDAFSECSIKHLWNIVGPLNCVLTGVERYFNASMTNMRCGNYVVEGWETCDCGSYKQCYSNKCCKHDCLLEPGAVCNGELCCTNCTYSIPGTLCRPIQNICDLPEYCKGSNYYCPDNFYLQDGTPCTEEAYCYKGNCTDRTMHCKEIFGINSVNANDACYTVNRRGDRFGHCKQQKHSIAHVACSNEDVKCGRLQCSNITHVPLLPDRVSFHQSKISEHWCWGVDRIYSPETADIGHVRNGTPCAPGRFCANSFCNGTINALIYDCRPEKCHFRGICNNQRNCHCHVGWEPPLCSQRGPGGSINSGPSSRRIRSVQQSNQEVFYLRVVLGRLYAFIAALLFGVATNVKNIKTRSKVSLRLWPRNET
uniref:Disintegrin and metalloproteinase domain-containing protein 21 n=1 Tax=Catagonus wagneri TaxID=51154 RepID=A0A8C3YL45_9CETA